MKRAISLLLILLLALSLCGCRESRWTGGKTKVLCTSFPTYDLARRVAGEDAEVKMLLPPGAEIHTYEPTAGDLLLLGECDLFFTVGGENEAWVEQLLAAQSRPVEVVRMLDWGETEEEEPLDSHEESHEHSHETDEHIWTSPRRLPPIVQAFAQALSQKDSAHGAAYQSRAQSYVDELRSLDARLTALIEAAPRREIIVGDRFPFLYLVKDYGLSYRAAFPGCSEESEPSAAVMGALCREIREKGIPVVLHVEFSSPAVAEALAEACGVKTATLHSCHTLSKEDLEAGETYLSLMERNCIVLKEALGA